MNELHRWLASQHAGLRTFKTFQRKLADLAAEHPGQRAMCRLLGAIVGSYIEEFDEAPLPLGRCGTRLSKAASHGCRA
jgi:hypothetical protein